MVRVGFAFHQGNKEVSVIPVEIVVTSPPPHRAPGWVRKAWKGLRLPLAESVAGKPGYHVAGLTPGTRIDPRSNGGYEVAIGDALHALQGKDPKAAGWLRRKSILPLFGFEGNLIFAKDSATVAF